MTLLGNEAHFDLAYIICVSGHRIALQSGRLFARLCSGFTKRCF